MNASTITKVLKKSVVSTVLIVALCLITIAATRVYKNIEKESWVNSYYNELSIEERAGLLIWFNIDCNKDLDTQLALIQSLSTGGVVLENCNCETSLSLSEKLKQLPVIVTAERDEIEDIPYLVYPDGFENSSDLKYRYNQILEQEIELYGFDFYNNSSSENNLNLHEYTGNQRLLRKDLLKSDGLIINDDLKHIYYQTVNLIRDGELSEKLLENKAKKILEVKYDKRSSEISISAETDRWNRYYSSINQYNHELITKVFDLTIAENFNLNFNDRVAVIGVGESFESASKALKTHLHAVNSFNYLDQLPSNPENHFNKYIIIDTELSQDQLVSLAGDILLISTSDNPLKEGSLYFPFNDPLSYERIVTRMLSDSFEQPQVLTYNHLPEDAGLKSSDLNTIDKIVEEAIKEEAFPGCQVLVAHQGKVVINRSYGYHSYDSLLKVNNQTIYDLASVTKAAATTLSVMKLSYEGVIDIDKKASYYLNELKGTDKENIILKDILLHQSGLRSYLPYWKRALSKKKYYLRNNYSDEFRLQIAPERYLSKVTPDSLWSWIIDTPLYEKEDEKQTYNYKYSDIGFYFLKAVVERVTTESLDSYLQQNIYDPMGIYYLSYNPLHKFSSADIVPTEYDKYLRKTLLVGNVHDRNAALRGGVEGHAGLFGNSSELAKLLQMMLYGGSYGNQHFFNSETIETFTSSHYVNNRRGLGWDKSSNDIEDNTSDYASLSTFGHTGFTGTGFWADPENDLIYVFLSNRVYPDAENNKISEMRVRENIQDVIYQSILD